MSHNTTIEGRREVAVNMALSARIGGGGVIDALSLIQDAKLIETYLRDGDIGFEPVGPPAEPLTAPKSPTE